MRVAAVIGDLLFYSRIESAAHATGASLMRVASPEHVPEGVDLVLIDWSEREPSWIGSLQSRREAGARLVLFGPHTDLASHAAARKAGLGPMWARSRLVRELPALFAPG